MPRVFDLLNEFCHGADSFLTGCYNLEIYGFLELQATYFDWYLGIRSV